MHPWASCDNWNFNASNPCVYAGGNYNQNQNQGLFYFNYNTASNSNGNIGSRTYSVCLANKRSPRNIAWTAAHPLVKIS